MKQRNKPKNRKTVSVYSLYDKYFLNFITTHVRNILNIFVCFHCNRKKHFFNGNTSAQGIVRYRNKKHVFYCEMKSVNAFDYRM